MDYAKVNHRRRLDSSKFVTIWHMVAGGKILCGVKSDRAAEMVDAVEKIPEGGLVCRNCDQALRYPGQEAARKVRKKNDRRTVYRPRFKFEE